LGRVTFICVSGGWLNSRTFTPQAWSEKPPAWAFSDACSLYKWQFYFCYLFYFGYLSQTRYTRSIHH